MAFYDKFPYTNFQEINLDRLIQELIIVKNKLDFVIENASLKYADPIQWNITHQYQANTVVIDPETGIAYISTKPVPDNILITDTGYWTAIFDLSPFFDETEEAIAALQTAIDTINTNLATETTNREDADTALGDRISAETTNREDADTALGDRISAETTALSDRIDAAEQFMEDFLIQHYVLDGEDRSWLHIHNQTEFDEYLQMFRHGLTSKSCYIESSGTYKLTGGSGSQGIYPVFNGAQMHIYVTSPGVIIDLNCATFYTGHLVIAGQNGERVKIIDTNAHPDAADRTFYPEGSTSFFENCDFYTTITIWSGAAHFTNCAWYDYKASKNACLDLLGGAICDVRNGLGYYKNGFYNSSDSILGIGPNCQVAITGRFTVKRPSTSSGYLIRYRNGGQFTLQLDGSFYDPDNERSYSSSNVGSLLGAILNSNNAIFQVYANAESSVEQLYYTGAAQTWSHALVQIRSGYGS